MSVTGQRARSLLVLVGIGIGIGVAACGSSDPPGRTPSGAKASCASDSDCVITTGETCCKPCEDNPRAIPAFEHERQRNKCAATSCQARSDSDRIECPTVESPAGYVAKCQQGTCAAVKK